MKSNANLLNFFENLEDHRIERGKKHLLLNIIGIFICRVFCETDSWNEIEEYGIMKKEWLSD